MNPDLEKLIALQSADLEIDRLRQEIAALPGRVAEIESKLAETRGRGEKAKAGLAAIQTERRKLESAILGHQQKISKYREQSLAVKTNEQYKALLQEVTYEEEAIRGSEDRILEGMLSAESQEKELKAAEAELKAEMAEIEKEKAVARERTAEDEKQLAEWNEKRKQLRGDISADVVRYYDRVVKLRRTGISPVREQKCLSCYVVLRPQTYNEVRTNQQIIPCDSCGRILYYLSTPEGEAAGAGVAETADRDAAESSAAQ